MEMILWHINGFYYLVELEPFIRILISCLIKIMNAKPLDFLGLK